MVKNNSPNSNDKKSEDNFVIDIGINRLDKFPNHPFRILDDEKMDETVESIKEYGILMPLLVRKKTNGNYEIISGHRRKRASEIAGITSLPCLVKNLSDDEATIIMVDSNIQRENLLPSEKAFAYKMKLDALKHQGKRTDLIKQLTSDQVGPKLERSNEQLVSVWGDSISQIKRYIRLTELIPELLELVDIKKIAFNPAVELSYLKKEEQLFLIDTIQCLGATPSLSQAQKMKRLSQSNLLTNEKIEEIMCQEKGNQELKYEISYTKFMQYIPRNIATPKEVQNYLLKCAIVCKERGIDVEKLDIALPKDKPKNKNRDAR